MIARKATATSANDASAAITRHARLISNRPAHQVTVQIAIQTAMNGVASYDQVQASILGVIR